MGELRYMEIAAADAGRAHGFWSGLFGWRFNGTPSPEQPYVMAQAAELGIGLYGDEDPGLWPYFYVADVAATARQVADLGGQVLGQGPVPGVGWYARCADTEGNRFGLFQPDPAAAAPDGA